MFGWLKRRRERMRLAPVAGAVPALLSRSFGPAPTYTAAQVKIVAAKLKLSAPLTTMALAACCREADFAAAEPTRTSVDYRDLRAALAATFDIDRPKFTCAHLLALRNVPRGAKWDRDPFDPGGLYRDDYLGGSGGGHGPTQQGD